MKIQYADTKKVEVAEQWKWWKLLERENDHKEMQTYDKRDVHD